MRWPDQLRLRVRSLLRRGRVDEELSRELRFHLDQQTDEHIAAGMTPRDARFAALRETGNVLRISEECRDTRGLSPLDDLTQDVRYALRTLARNPGFAGVSILTLALGIGLTTGVFSVVSAVLLRPLPYDDADRLVAIVENVPAAETFRGVAMRTSAMNQDEILWWRTHAQTLHLAAAMPVRQTIRTADRTVRLSGLRVSPAWFEIYGVQPARGRWLRPDEERPDADVIVISTAMWREFLGSDPRVLERTIVLDARSYRVVGVMPANVFANIAFWLPFFAEPSTPDATTFVSVTSRLRDGVSLEAAAAGSYRLQTVSDDGVRVWADGALLIDNWTRHAPVTNTTVPIALRAGQRVSLRIEYFDSGGSATLHLLWQPPGETAFSAVPAGRLYSGT